MQDDTVVRPQRSQPRTETANEVAYPVGQIVAGAEQIFGHPVWVVEGALSYAKIDLTGNVTKTQVQQALDEFLKQEDKTHAEVLRLQQQEGR